MENVTIKITILNSSCPDKLASSHTITDIASKGIVKPPGTLKVFSDGGEPAFLSFKVANTAPK